MNDITEISAEMKREFSGPADPEKFLDKILEYLQLYSSEEQRNLILKKTPQWNRVFGASDEILAALGAHVGSFAGENPELGRLLLQKLWQRGSREEQIIACFGASGLFEYDADRAYRFFMEWIPDMGNREITDIMALDGFRPYLLKNRGISLLLSASLVKSPNSKIRRFGIMMLTPLLENPDDTVSGTLLKIAGSVMKDRDEDVRNAVGEFLRKMSRNNPEKVWEFLSVYLHSKDPNIIKTVKTGSSEIPAEMREGLI